MKQEWETLANEAIADAGEWKRETHRLRVINAELVAALEWAMNNAEWSSADDGTDPIRLALYHARSL